MKHATQPRLPSLAGTALIAALLGLATFFPASSGATPARYVFEVCDSVLPGGGTNGAHFAVNPGVPLTPSNTCGSPGGALGITETGHVLATYSFWAVPISTTPGGTVESLTISGAACTGSPGTKAFVYEQGFPANCAGESQRIFHISGLFLGEPWIFLSCDGNYGPGCEAGPSVYAHYFAATEVDPIAPTLAKLRGSLISGNVIRGDQSIGIDAHDKGGGLTRISLLVNGVSAAPPKASNCNVTQANNRSVVGTIAVVITPCPTDVSADWNVSSEVYPFHDGTNSVSICAEDFSTLNEPNKTCETRTIAVDNSCPDTTARGGEVLSAQFSASNADTTTVDYGQGAVVTGKLANNAGDPVGGASLCIKEQTIGVDVRAHSVGAVKTDENGRYSYQVPAGPNREVTIGYRDDSRQVSRDVRIYSHVKPKFVASPTALANHHRVRFWGNLPGPNNGGRVLILQANPPHSKRWITFRRATAGSDGSYGTYYRFNSTTSVSKYRFQAIVPEQSGYPWLEGASDKVEVKVTPCAKGRRRVNRHGKTLCLPKHRKHGAAKAGRSFLSATAPN